MKKNREKEKEEFLYCNQRHCPHLECLRHDRHIPFGKMIKREAFKPDKDWNCKNIITER